MPVCIDSVFFLHLVIELDKLVKLHFSTLFQIHLWNMLHVLFLFALSVRFTSLIVCPLDTFLSFLWFARYSFPHNEEVLETTQIEIKPKSPVVPDTCIGCLASANHAYNIDSIKVF